MGVARLIDRLRLQTKRVRAISLSEPWVGRCLHRDFSRRRAHLNANSRGCTGATSNQRRDFVKSTRLSLISIELSMRGHAKAVTATISWVSAFPTREDRFGSKAAVGSAVSDPTQSVSAHCDKGWGVCRSSGSGPPAIETPPVSLRWSRSNADSRGWKSRCPVFAQVVLRE